MIAVCLACQGTDPHRAGQQVWTRKGYFYRFFGQATQKKIVLDSQRFTPGELVCAGGIFYSRRRHVHGAQHLFKFSLIFDIVKHVG